MKQTQPKQTSKHHARAGRTSTPKKAAAARRNGRKGGRPLKISTPAEFDARVDAFVTVCRESETPMTWTGMALAMGFYGRRELDEYAHHDGFSDSVKRAKLLVERAYEQRLSGSNPTGAIFALKNMGWSDKQQIEHSGGVALRKLSDEDLNAEIERLAAEAGYVKRAS